VQTQTESDRLTKNFHRDEFACKCGCGLNDISTLLVAKLQDVRESLGKPIQINSGLRCPQQNEDAGSNAFSPHLYGFAADIKCENSTDRSAMLPLLLRKFRRVGIGKDFIHVDVDPQKDQGVCWVYGK